MKLLRLALIAWMFPTLPVSAESLQQQVEALRTRVRAQDAEIARLQRELATAPRQRQLQEQTPIVTAGRVPNVEPSSGAAPTASPATSVALTPQADEEDLLVSALETSLVRQGGRVLSQGAVELDPEFSYFYDEPVRARRRDLYGSALTARFGLPWATQLEVRLPYIISDRWPGVGTSSGIGDIRLGLTTELLAERDWLPALLPFAQWRTTTGDINRSPPTGFGQDALRFGITASKRQDPIVLFGSVSYIANLGSAHLRSGSKVNAGDVFGGRLGAFLAVTPDTSLLLAIAANSFSASRFDDMAEVTSDRLRGNIEIGLATTLARDLFLNITAEIGITPDVPNFGLVVSVPYRF